MIIRRTATFKKQYLKLPLKVQLKFDKHLVIFVDDPSNIKLRNHQLKGKYKEYYSINVTGDVRALYRKEGDEIVIFAFIGTHSQLY